MNGGLGQDSEVLACYERLSMLSQQLLAHARLEQWGSLPPLEEECSAIVELLRRIEPCEELEAAQLLRKHSLLSRIRCDYDAVAEKVQPQLQRLRDVLHTMHRQRMLRCYEQR